MDATCKQEGQRAFPKRTAAVHYLTSCGMLGMQEVVQLMHLPLTALQPAAQLRIHTHLPCSTAQHCEHVHGELGPVGRCTLAAAALDTLADMKSAAHQTAKADMLMCCISSGMMTSASWQTCCHTSWVALVHARLGWSAAHAPSQAAAGGHAPYAPLAPTLPLNSQASPESLPYTSYDLLA